TLSGTTLQTTDASGVATFSNLSINLTGSKNLTASSGAVSVLSSAFTITAAAVSTLTFGQPPTDATAGALISPAVTVLAKDSLGNNVPSVSVVMPLGPGSTGTLSGTTTQSTDASGVATFGNLSINLAGSKTLKATSGAVSVVSGAFTISPAAA